MEGKPLHYDGSIQNNELTQKDPATKEQFQLTDEMRVNIGGNPYNIENIE